MLSRLIAEIHASPVNLVMSVAGGGSDAITQLLRVPGASRTLLEAVIPYHPEALSQYLQSVPENFCDLATARSMAMVAYQRALILGREKKADELAGVACTAALATDREKKGQHRLHIAIQTCRRSAALTLQLNKGERDRSKEEDVTTTLLLNEIAALCGVTDSLPLPLLPGEQIERYDAPAEPRWRELLHGEIDVVCMPRPDTPRPDTLFPGAFNPLHAGHEKIADIATAITGAATAMEISIVNADKPPLDYAEMATRAQQVTSRFDLWFTRAATFVEKANLFPGVTFVVGSDTIERIADPLYYHDDSANRDRAIRSIRDLGCRFLVFGRKEGTRFVSLGDIELPALLLEICQEVAEERFRMDISSTELRRHGVESLQP